ncbi:MAG: lipoyl synthase [Desulforegulaceae bacterium]|nr:lipoyl synthase [Desulforegulaceae bacterium]
MSQTYSRKILKDQGIRVSKPKWLRKPLPSGPEYEKIQSLLKKGGLHTVCSQAKCPNQFECYSKGTATFLILGEKCTRNCKFCAIEQSFNEAVDKDEPKKVANAAKEMDLKYVVVTSVTRDDLEDGGAFLFAEVICELKKNIKNVFVEVLIPDFKGNEKALDIVLNANPDVLNHNVETSKNIYEKARPMADYEQSLKVLSYCKNKRPDIYVKSGLMTGLGETREELDKTIKDIKNSGADFITIGQYLQPSLNHLLVEKFYSPQEFEDIRKFCENLGFKGVASGPFVRSSYKAFEMFGLNK